MTVTLVDVLAAARARCAPLVGELAGYLVLGVADQVAAAPRRVSATDVTLNPDGAVALVGGRAASERVAEAALRDLLRQLLANARSASPALSRASHGACGRGVVALVRELEASLIPVNRSAGKRAATRLYRETKRALDQGALDALREDLARSQCAETKSDEASGASTSSSVAGAVPAEHDVADAPAQAAPANSGREPSADEADPSNDPEFSEFSGAHHIELVVESSVPPPTDLAPQPSGPRHGEAEREPAQQWTVPVEEDVTRPEPLVLKATRPELPDRQASHGVPHGHRSTGEHVELDDALTPPLGSIAATQNDPASDEGCCGVPDAVAAAWEAERTDPMHQGEYLEISESLGNYALELGLSESKIELVEPAPPSSAEHLPAAALPASVHDPGEGSLGEGSLAASPAAPAEASEVGPPSGAGSPRRAFSMESPPWAANATAALYPSAVPVDVQLRDPEWVWPDLSPVPPASVLAIQPAVASKEVPILAAAKAVLAASPAVSRCGQASGDESLPPEDAWDVAMVEAAAPVARAAPAASALSPRRSQVTDLLASFSVADQREDGDVCRDLKQMAGLDLTPLPPAGVGEE
jgi:hypothetical protein